MALNTARCENVETRIRKQRLYLLGESKSWLTKQVMFGAMSGGGNPFQGRPEKNWMQYFYLVDCRHAVQAIAGPTEESPSVFGGEIVLWMTAAQKERHFRKAGVESLVER